MNPLQHIEQFKALDACHQKIHEQLAELADLLERLDTESDSPHCRQKAKTIEAFFSEVARPHHAEEEKNVFPALLASDNAELVQAVRTLQQDHGWIEQNWLELAPMLRAIALGEDWADVTELKHNAEVFVNLCHDHIMLEESLIYPEAKAHLIKDFASRAARLAQK
ncbi:MAG: hemerythrin domain-containing protein [Rhodoferax sp.]|jgi:hemerythrin-like domain-containing protein|uniref:hemerythrin domain-containing protein n=1 Tax=Rhodoferax sp. TaxID=50421 RepID=UPI00272F2B08|nr:hemerythrin domain-containing protein [Rhodoferax sp.]MDP1528302.1 hemerythrin domain-containing protein [Rhodoferax sp.]MDP1945580.1 hemerythrin domain-containing protein [Rhodoferax sp.]MDP3191775.1 hemerythrin domain-containing protein [Rhodoferax sp.]MDP3335623.1 hemerythrin domain-containing protein [Rhodoferax sp.]MDP3864239.1 hemerythrin domain-containing protein [Rhodoferax sp.]